MHHTARQQKCVTLNVRLDPLRPHTQTLLAPKTVLILEEPSETQSNEDDSAAIHERAHLAHRVIFDLVIFQRGRSLDTGRPPGRFATLRATLAWAAQWPCGPHWWAASRRWACLGQPNGPLGHWAGPSALRAENFLA